jgi:hypothetical protein
MDTDYPMTPERVDGFVIEVAKLYRVAGPKSHECAVALAALMLRDRLYRDFTTDDIIRLARQMRDEAADKIETVMLRAKYALPREGINREVHWPE